MPSFSKNPGYLAVRATRPNAGARVERAGVRLEAGRVAPLYASRSGGILRRVAVVIECVLVAAALPYLLLAVSSWPSRTEPARWGSDYDNQAPRDSQARLRGWRKRAHAAQLNGHEAFAPFAIGMLCAQLSGVPQPFVRALGYSFLALRVLYGVFYVTNQATLRSTTWVIGIAVVVMLYVQALLRVW